MEDRNTKVIMFDLSQNVEPSKEDAEVFALVNRGRKSHLADQIIVNQSGVLYLEEKPEPEERSIEFPPVGLILAMIALMSIAAVGVITLTIPGLVHPLFTIGTILFFIPIFIRGGNDNGRTKPVR